MTRYTALGDAFPPDGHLIVSADNGNAVTARFEANSVLLTRWYNRVDYDGNLTGLWVIEYDAGINLNKAELTKLFELSSDKLRDQ